MSLILPTVGMFFAYFSPKNALLDIDCDPWNLFKFCWRDISLQFEKLFTSLRYLWMNLMKYSWHYFEFLALTIFAVLLIMSVISAIGSFFIPFHFLRYFLDSFRLLFPILCLIFYLHFHKPLWFYFFLQEEHHHQNLFYQNQYLFFPQFISFFLFFFPLPFLWLL